MRFDFDVDELCRRESEVAGRSTDQDCSIYPITSGLREQGNLEAESFEGKKLGNHRLTRKCKRNLREESCRLRLVRQPGRSMQYLNRVINQQSDSGAIVQGRRNDPPSAPQTRLPLSSTPVNVSR